MLIKKPSVSSSVGIEIKTPVGIELEGDTAIIPKQEVAKELEWIVGITIYFSDGSDEYRDDFNSKREAIAFCRDVAVHGFTKRLDGKPGRYKHYMPSAVLFVNIEIETEEDDY